MVQSSSASVSDYFFGKMKCNIQTTRTLRVAQVQMCNLLLSKSYVFHVHIREFSLKVKKQIKFVRGAIQIMGNFLIKKIVKQMANSKNCILVSFRVTKYYLGYRLVLLMAVRRAWTNRAHVNKGRAY